MNEELLKQLGLHKSLIEDLQIIAKKNNMNVLKYIKLLIQTDCYREIMKGTLES
jgi:RNase P subunit RPR2